MKDYGLSKPSRRADHSSVERSDEMPYYVGNRYYRTLYGARMAADRQYRPVWHEKKRVYEPSTRAASEELARVHGGRA